MQVNTKTGLKLTKRELDTLVSASAILGLIAKHGDSAQEGHADKAMQEIDQVIDLLIPVDESTLVGAK